MKNLMTFEEAKKYVAKFKFKTEEEYKTWWDLNKEENEKIGLPRNPDEVYS